METFRRVSTITSDRIIQSFDDLKPSLAKLLDEQKIHSFFTALCSTPELQTIWFAGYYIKALALFCLSQADKLDY